MDGKVIRFGAARVVSAGLSGLQPGADASGAVLAVGQVSWAIPAPGGCHVGVQGGLVLALPSPVGAVLGALGIDFGPPQAPAEERQVLLQQEAPAPGAEPPPAG